MNFFEHQQLARRNSRVMVVLFLFAVIGVVAAVDLALFVAWRSGMNPGDPAALELPYPLLAWGALITIGVILSVSLINVAKLGGGGEKVAEMAGARRVASNTQDPLERRLQNIVEEMAIASGVRVPQVFVMDDEPGINAFAAGWNSSEAVVAVTRGALETLNRDELQGVIGHEFSHILNGDMRLNIRMLGVLAGIVFIGSIGSFVMRHAGRGKRSREAAGMFLFGLALFLIGYVGLFFGRLIKAAVSRQREFLADASSVQFTRNPDAIAGALDRIRASSHGALIQARAAEDLSHMFFGDSLRQRFGGMLATHPPLDERIKRISPRFHASEYRRTRVEAAPAAATSPTPAVAAGFAGAAGRESEVAKKWERTPTESANLVGTLDVGKIDQAARLLDTLPSVLREAVHDPEDAPAAILALMMAPAPDVAEQQFAALNTQSPGDLGSRAASLTPHTQGLSLALHLPVVDLALATMKAAAEPKKRELVAALEAVVHADSRISLHEFIVLTLVKEQLAPRKKASKAGAKRIFDLRVHCMTLLSLAAQAGGNREASQAALKAGAEVICLDVADVLLNLETVGKALEALKDLAPMQKELLIKSLFATVTYDGSIRVAEAGVMRLIGAVLDCPLPPLLVDGDPQT